MGRVGAYAWPIAQAAVAAGIAWFLTHTVLGHPQPFFAPIAAVVALAVGTGRRGTQAVQMLAGVAVGVVVGELLVLVLGTGTLGVILATAVAMLVMATASTQPLPLIQAGASAVLIVSLQSPESGSERTVDALVGGGVALFISQVLLPPSPVLLLKDAGREALSSIAEGLHACARSLSDGDAAAAEAALECLREEGLSSTADLAATRETSEKVARRTLRGRREEERFRHLDARLGEVDLLAGSALLLTRAARRLLDERVAAPGQLVTATEELAHAAEALAEDPESPDARRRARDSALETKRQITLPARTPARPTPASRSSRRGSASPPRTSCGRRRLSRPGSDRRPEERRVRITGRANRSSSSCQGSIHRCGGTSRASYLRSR